MGAACGVNWAVIGNSEDVKVRGAFTDVPRLFHFGTTCPEVGNTNFSFVLLFAGFCGNILASVIMTIMGNLRKGVLLCK